MGMPDCEEYTNPTIQTGWQHCFTFPREIFEKNGKICQRPIRELDEKKHLVSAVKGMLSSDGYSVYELEILNIAENHFKVILSNELIRIKCGTLIFPVNHVRAGVMPPHLHAAFRIKW